MNRLTISSKLLKKSLLKTTPTILLPTTLAWLPPWLLLPIPPALLESLKITLIPSVQRSSNPDRHTLYGFIYSIIWIKYSDSSNLLKTLQNGIDPMLIVLWFNFLRYCLLAWQSLLVCTFSSHSSWWLSDQPSLSPFHSFILLSSSSFNNAL